MQQYKLRIYGSTIVLPPHLLRYVIVGGCAYVFELACLYFFRHTLGAGNERSVAVSFWTGLFFAFILQKLVTFRNYDKHPRAMTRQLGLYGLLVAWNYGFTLLVTHLLAQYITVYIIRTAVIIITTIWNFYIYRHLFSTQAANGQ